MKNIATVLAATALTLSFMSVQTQADDFVIATVASNHKLDMYCYEGECDEFNESNPGLGLEIERSKHTAYVGGFYKNSYYKNSFYAGMKLKYDMSISNDITVTAAADIGVITGYADTPEKTFGGLAPMVLPNLSVQYKRVKATVGLIPSPINPVATFQVGFAF